MPKRCWRPSRLTTPLINPNAFMQNHVKAAENPIEPLPRGWKKMPRRFFTEPPEVLAPKLLGKLLARYTSVGWLAGRIVEVEAYLGPHITATPDPAAHSFRGITD